MNQHDSSIYLRHIYDALTRIESYTTAGKDALMTSWARALVEAPGIELRRESPARRSRAGLNGQPETRRPTKQKGTLVGCLLLVEAPGIEPGSAKHQINLRSRAYSPYPRRLSSWIRPRPIRH
jgi:hypothetical protein